MNHYKVFIHCSFFIHSPLQILSALQGWRGVHMYRAALSSGAKRRKPYGFTQDSGLDGAVLSASFCFTYIIIFWNSHQGWINEVRKGSEIRESFLSLLGWKTLSGKGSLKLLTAPEIPPEASCLVFRLLL